MNDISVQHSSTLYNHSHSASCFLCDIESARNQLKSDLELLFADSYTHVNRIQDALECYQSDIEGINMQIENLRDRMRAEEDTQIRREITEDIQGMGENLSEAKEMVRICKDDMRHAEVLRQEINIKISMVKSLLDELRSSVSIDIDASTDFIRKYISYLQTATTTM